MLVRHSSRDQSEDVQSCQTRSHASVDPDHPPGSREERGNDRNRGAAGRGRGEEVAEENDEEVGVAGTGAICRKGDGVLVEGGASVAASVAAAMAVETRDEDELTDMMNGADVPDLAM